MMEKIQYSNLVTGTWTVRKCLGLFIIVCCLSTQKAQITAQSSATAVGNPYIEHDDIIINCTFDNVPSNEILSKIIVERDINSTGFTSVVEFNVTANILQSISYDSGAVSGKLGANDMYYEVTLSNILQTDAGQYQCRGEYESGMSTTVSQTASVNVVPPCDTNPCDRGNCTNVDATRYTCTCDTGYDGTNCDHNIDDCVGGPCVNLGTCIDGIGSFTCTCTPCFNGTLCQNEIQNLCNPNPCKNGGTCVNSCTSYTCTCPDGKTGPVCDQECGLVQNVTGNVQPILGTNLTLSCDASNTANRVWWSKSESGHPMASTDKVLIKNDVRPSDSELYYCFAENSQCKDVHKLSIEVKWEISPSEAEKLDKTLHKHDDVTFLCTVNSTPNAMVHWLFAPLTDEREENNTNENSTAPIQPITTDLANATLDSSEVVLTGIDKSHAGTYTCIATLPHGINSVIKVYNIRVVDKPRKKGLSWWAIVLIVVILVIVLAVIIVIIVYFVCVKKNESGLSIFKANKIEARRNKNESCESPREDSYDVRRSPIIPTDKSRRKSSTSESIEAERHKSDTKDRRSHTGDNEEKPRKEPPALPYMPEGGRGQSLEPLNVDEERKRLKRKKMKTYKEQEEEEDNKERSRREDKKNYLSRRDKDREEHDGDRRRGHERDRRRGDEHDRRD